MRCRSCNEILTNKEAVRKSGVTGDYFELCDPCLGYILDDLPLESIDAEDDIWDEIPEDNES